MYRNAWSHARVKGTFSDYFLVNVTKQIHEGVYLNWLHKTILRLSHLFQISFKCFKCYIEKEKKCSFENALIEKSESSTNLK